MKLKVSFLKPNKQVMSMTKKQPKDICMGTDPFQPLPPLWYDHAHKFNDFVKAYLKVRRRVIDL